VQNFVSQENQPLNTPSTPAKPSQIVTLWATGLGAISGPDNVAPPAGDLPGGVEAFIGGKMARVLYGGRSPCCAATDQIVVQVPGDAPTGCWVPVQIRTGRTTSSNAVTMAITADGQPCTDPYAPLIAAASRPRTGVVLLLRGASPMGLADLAHAYFTEVSATGPGGGLFSPVSALPPEGACTTYSASPGSMQDYLLQFFRRTGRALAAGIGFSVTAPGRAAVNMQANRVLPLLFSEILGLGSSLPGSYTISGSGGADVGAFQVTLSPPAPVNWSNQTGTERINRTAGLTVVYDGGGQTGPVMIAGISADEPVNAAAAFACLAPAAEGRFVVPPYVLSRLPATRKPGEAPSAGIFVGVAPRSFTSFSATGIDAGVAVAFSGSYRDVVVQ
jgi:hypothetical protein